MKRNWTAVLVNFKFFFDSGYTDVMRWDELGDRDDIFEPAINIQGL